MLRDPALTHHLAVRYNSLTVTKTTDGGPMGSSVELFSPFASHYQTLVETGTWTGDGIERALTAGFKTILSCDVNEDFVLAARRRFEGLPVTVYLGTSEEALSGFVGEIKEPAVFFLDAHAMPPSPSSSSFSDATLTPGNKSDPRLQCPIEREVQIILEQGFRGDTILIDDRQCFDTWMFNFLSESTVRRLVENLCPGRYTFSYWKNVLCITPRGIESPAESLHVRWGRGIKVNFAKIVNALSRGETRDTPPSGPQFQQKAKMRQPHSAPGST